MLWNIVSKKKQEFITETAFQIQKYLYMRTSQKTTDDRQKNNH